MRVSNLFKQQNLQHVSNLTGILIIILMAVIAPWFGGYDYRVAYRGDTLAGTFLLHSAFPYPASWLIYPFAVLPETLGYLLWNIVSAICFLVAIRYWNGNFLSFSFFIGTFWVFYGGQIEGLMTGALLLIMSPNPLWAGLGITILSFKPQIGFLPILFILINKREWKLLLIPSIVYILSFIRWGWWVDDWLRTLLTVKDTAQSMVTMISFFPYGLILLPVLWRYTHSLKIWLYIQSIVMPYYPVYSLAPVFAISSPPIWVNLLIWGFYLSLPGDLSLSKFGVIIPLALLGYEIWKIEKTTKTDLSIG